MRLVVQTEPGVFEVNFMWIPSWIGFNTALMSELPPIISEGMEGRVIDEDLLDELDARVVAWAVKRFPNIQGLDAYLDALKFVKEVSCEPPR